MLAFSGFIESNPNGVDRIERIRCRSRKKIGQPRRNPGGNDSRPMFIQEMLREPQLLGANGTGRQMSGHIEVMRSHMERGTEDALITHSRKGVHHQLRSAGDLDDAPKIASIHPFDRNRMLWGGPQKTVGPFRISIAARHLMALTSQEFHEIRTGCSNTKHKNTHGIGSLSQLEISEP